MPLIPTPNYFLRGGYKSFANFSGTAAGNDVLIWSGTGRLNSLLQHTQMQSGQSVVFYDSAVATSGGPFALSGHTIVGVLPPTWLSAASGVNAPFTGLPLIMDMPFRSGLCAATRSGTPGFTAVFTQETNNF